MSSSGQGEALMEAERECPQPSGYRLAPPQSSAWTQVHSRPGAPGCHAIAAVLPTGADHTVATLRLRLERLVRAHEVLRTRFVRYAGLSEPLQIVCDMQAQLIELHTASWRDAEPQQVAAHKERLWNRVLAMPLELGVHAHVIELPGNALYVVLAVAPLAADHRTLLQLLACVTGNRPDAAADVLQYCDVSSWLLELNATEEADGGRRFWQEALRHSDSDARLSLDLRAPWAPASLRTLRLPVPAPLAQAVLESAARLAVTEEDFYFASWVFLLRTMSENELQPCVARSFDGVSDPSLASVLGVLERCLPFAVAGESGAVDAVALKRIARACEEMRDLQDFFAASAAVGAEPYLFQFLLTTGLGADVERLSCLHTRFRVRATVLKSGAASACTVLEYPHSVLADAAAAALGAQWHGMLAGMAGATEGARYRIRFDPQLERHVLSLASGESRAPGGPDNVLAWMESSCSAGHAATLVSGERELSLLAVNERANRAAHFLRNEGVGRGAVVGLQLRRGIEYVLAMLAVLKCGAAYMPMDVDYPAERLHYMVQTAAPALLIVATEEAARESNGSRVLTLAALESLAASLPSSAPPLELHADDAAYVLFTSGSTGKPKGVVISHGGLFNHMRWMIEQFQFTHSHVFLQRTSTSFDASVWELWAPLLCGGRMVIADPQALQDFAHLVGQMRRHDVSVAQFVPSMLDMLLTLPQFSALSSLQQVFVGGEALTPALKGKYFERMAARLINLYGPTEACIDASFQICSPEGAPRVSIGRPIHNTRLVVVDDDGQLAGIGVTGEICISGPGLFKGYIQRPDLTADKVFVPAFCTERYYRSGDLGRMIEDGSIDYLGRKDHQVKLRGQRIELSEIDRVLEEQPGVVRGITLVSDGSLVAVVQVEQERFATEAVLAGLRRQLPGYMVPSRMVVLEKLPLLSNGKLDRTRLGEWVAAEQRRSAFAPPSTPLQHTLAAIWGRVLKRDRISVSDRFFAIGGDSIRSVQIVYEAGLEGLHFTVMDLFTHQSITALAEYLESAPRAAIAQPAAAVAVAPESPVPRALLERFADCYPATSMQRYMLEHYAADTARRGVFHVQQSYRLTLPRLDCAGLTRALIRAADSPNFRTGFVVEGGETYQVLLPDPTFRVEVIDLSERGEAQGAQIIRATIERDRMQAFEPFSLAGPLLRMHLFVLDAHVCELFLSNHHAVQDGWGNLQFLQRVVQAYRGLMSGEPLPEPPSANTCKEFALLQNTLARDPAQGEFWRREARTLRTVVNPSCQDPAESSTVALDLDADLVRSVRAAAEQGNVTVQAILLTACIEALAECGLGSTVGVVSNGRAEDLSDPLGAMGLFWNLVPFAAPADEGRGLARCVAVQEKLVRLRPYARFPLQVVEQWAGGAPTFGVTFNFIDFREDERPASDQAGVLKNTHSLDNFGFPLGMTFSAGGPTEINMLLQRNALLPVSLEELSDHLLRRIGAVAAARSTGT